MIPEYLKHFNLSPWHKAYFRHCFSLILLSLISNEKGFRFHKCNSIFTGVSQKQLLFLKVITIYIIRLGTLVTQKMVELISDILKSDTAIKLVTFSEALRSEENGWEFIKTALYFQ